MNMARLNPLSMHHETGTYNYEVMLHAQDGLLAEAWAKMNAKEKMEADRIKDLIHSIIQKKPIFIQTATGLNFRADNYQRFMDLINLYERKNKEFLDTHNLNSPNADDDEGL
jgi:hypothetical protein